mmetsp:Transcript_25932/g.38394  ORF Transcript_25932/g.38394 Transcript_25932/m.38394 type:complete len:706 (+) Transcript_25932:140-2257(+)
MDSFEEWVKTAEYQCLQDWGTKLVELGASWDSFKRDSKDAIVNDLATGGIPLLAARDITDIVSAEVKKTQAPLAIFWDLENMPIPSETSGRDITSSLKNILSHQGDLIQFRGYASIGLNHIPQEKRSDLQLSGCHLVDCPHNGRKEVADKMIIVDAMQFAFQHPHGATMCFITGDVDYAYLLATLQRPQWRTIVISRGTMQSMLHVNCDMKMRWETDILQPIYETEGEKFRPTSNEEGDQNEYIATSTTSFIPLTPDEEWSDDVGLLCSVIKKLCQKYGSLAQRKSEVGNILRQTNPARFPQREMITSFLAMAIDRAVIIESGEGAWKTVHLPHHDGHKSGVPVLLLSHFCPVPEKDLLEKVKDKLKDLPVIVILRKRFCPSGTIDRPPNACVQSTSEWLFYMFRNQITANNAAIKCNWLQNGVMVNTKEKLTFPAVPVHLTTIVQQNALKGQMIQCQVCEAMVGKNTMILAHSFQFKVCSEDCKDWLCKNEEDKSRGVKLVVETMEFLASYDDLYSPISQLGKLILMRHEKECTTRKFAKLWILEAERNQAIKICKQKKIKYAVLPQHFDCMEAQYKHGDAATPTEEKFVFDLIFDEKCGWIDRKKINSLLSNKFNLQTPYARNQVFLNGREKQLFFVVKSFDKQIIALSNEFALSALKIERDDPMEAKEEISLDGPSIDSDDGSEDYSSNNDEEDLNLLICKK